MSNEPVKNCVVQFLYTKVYQLSVPSPPTPSSPGGAEKESASDKTKASVLSQRLGIDPLDLVGWNENLRVWLTQTVLRPLVKEIDSANAALPKQGVADCQIGQVAVERLRKVAALPQAMLQLLFFQQMLRSPRVFLT